MLFKVKKVQGNSVPKFNQMEFIYICRSRLFRVNYGYAVTKTFNYAFGTL